MKRTIIDILEELEFTSGSNAKRDILEAEIDNQLLKRVFLAAQDPYTVYYVNKFKMPRPLKGNGEDDDVRVQDFIDTITDWLATRKATGNQAKDVVVNLFAGMDERQQKWCQRILIRNLRCGVQESTVNKVWPGLINGFSVALADTLKSQFTRGKGIELLETVKYPVRVEPKLDGLRCIAVKRSGQVTLFTRNGTVLETLPRIKTALEKAEYDDVVLDGEAMGNDWNESASVLMSAKSKKDDSNICYVVFDAVPVMDWVDKETCLTYAERSKLADEVVCRVLDRVIVGSEKVVVQRIPHVTVNDENELKRYFADCMDRGYEGVMLKTLDTTYQWERSRNILKLKPCVTYEGIIVGWYEGRRGTKREGQFGGFYVMLPNHVITRVGGGFNDVLRASVQLTGPDTWCGTIVECEAQPDPLTHDGLSSEGKMRFPVYCRKRDASDVAHVVNDTWSWWSELTAQERTIRIEAVART